MLDHHYSNRNTNGKWQIIFHLETFTGRNSTFRVHKPKKKKKKKKLLQAPEKPILTKRQGEGNREKEKTASQNYCVLISRRKILNNLICNLLTK